MTPAPMATVRAGIGVLARAWWQMAAILAATSAGLALVGIFAISSLSFLASVQSGIVVDGRLTSRGAMLLAAEVGLPFLACGLLAFAATVGALAKVSDDVLAGRPVLIHAALTRGVRRAPALAVGFLLAGIGATGLLLASPLFVLAGVVGLVGWPIAALARRRAPDLPWPSPRRSALRAVPFLVPFAIILRWGLLVPAAALERNGGRAALVRSRTIVPAGWSSVSACMLAVAAFYLAWSAAFDALERSGAPFVVVLVALVVTQVVVIGVPVASVTSVYRDVAPSTPDHLQVVDPPPRQRPLLRPAAITTTIALVAGLGVAATHTSAASAAPVVTHTVVDLGDAPDAVAGDGTCEATVGVGDCTLRAAIDEANAAAVATGIVFASSGTITVGSPLVVHAPVEIDGAGQRVRLSSRVFSDSPPESQLLRFTSTIHPFAVANITLADGVGGPSGGGAIEAVAPAAGSVVANTTFIGNQSSAPGGAVAVLGGELTIQNATFRSNSSDVSGADVLDLGSTSILYSTLEGGFGASSSIESAGSAFLGSSIVTYTAGVACAGVVSGSHNLDDDGSCPGSSLVGTLGPFGSHGGPVDTYEISHASYAVNRGDATQCAEIGLVDARGTTRPHDVACDIGAYEHTGPASTAAVDVVSAPAPSDVGAPVVITATVGSTTEVLAGTGDVVFSSGGVELATVPLVDGVAEYTATSLSAGAHTFEVFFPGDALLPPATGSVDHEVSTPSSSVELATSPAPSELGDVVTLTATVLGTGAVAAPTGAVTFHQGGVVIDTVTLVGGVASTSVAELTVGGHTFEATYAGDAIFPTSSGTATHQVSVPGTTVALTTLPSPSLVGESVALTAVVSAPGTSVEPTGDVTFRDGTTELGTATIIGGTATLSTTALPAGVRTLHADYLGDGVFPAASGTVDHDVQADSVVSLTGPTSSVSGESVTFTATVLTAAGLTPDGQVTIGDGVTELVRATVGPDGTATFTTSSLPVGGHALRAEYEGDRLVLPGTSAVLDHGVARADSSVGLVASPAGSVVGEEVSFTATVSVDAPGTGVPTGTVTFSTGSGVLGVVPVDAAGVATFDTSGLPVGVSTVTAAYGGDGSYFPAEDLVSHEVFQGRTETSLVSSLAPSRLGEAVTLTATVSVVTPGVGTPTGEVRFVDGGQLLATVPLTASGEAVLTTTDLAVGSHPIVAQYVGSADLMPSDSPQLDQAVTRWSSAVTVTPSVSTSVTGQDVTFTATVVDVDGSGFPPSGSITFDGFGLSDPVVVPVDETAGTATITAPSPLGRGGSVSLAARYSGNAGLQGSSGATGVVVDPAPVHVALTTEPADPLYGQSVTVTATVTPVFPATGVPRGDFEVLDRGVRIRGPLDRTGTLTTTFTTPGDLGLFPHELTARFSGTGWVPAASSVVPLTVLPAPTALTLDVDPSPSVVGRQVSLTATMTVPEGAAPPIGELVHFDDGTDLIGSAPLQIVSGRYEATLTTSFSSVGQHPLRARFRGPNHEPSTSPVVDHAVDRLPTLVSIGSNSPTLSGDQVEISVAVSNLGGSASPTGAVSIERDGVTVAGPVPLSGAGTGLASATFTPVVPFPVGSHVLTAVYTPTGDFAAGAATHEHHVVSQLSDVTLDVGTGTVAWGRELTVSSTVSTSAAGAPRPASGTILITDGAGTSCAVAAPGGSCTLVWDAPGPHSLTAEYEGDELYGPAESIGRDITVERRASRVDAAVTPDPAVTGDPVRVAWTVPDHAGGQVSATIAGVRCVGAPTAGACAGSYPASSAGQPQDVVVAFAGDRLYLPSAATRTVTPVGCHRLALSGVDPAEGTIGAVTPGNCNDGRGYVEGTSVRVRVSPVANPAYDWIGVDWAGFGSTRAFDLDIVVGTGVGRVTSLQATLRREWNCFTVTWLDSETVPNPIRPIGGALEIDAVPSCPVDANGAPAPRAWERHPGFQRGRFLAGSTITAAPDPFPGMEFYGYRGVPDWIGPLEVVVDEDETIQGVFGPLCVDLQVVADGPGTARATTQTNCRNPLTDLRGFMEGTVVDVAARPDAAAYVDRWIGDVDSQGTDGDVFDSTLRRLAHEWTTSTTIRGDRTLQRSIAVIDACSRIDARPLWRGAGEGSAVRDRDGDCPTDDDPTLYRRGGTVSLEAVASSGAFGRWNQSDEPSDGHRFLTVSTDEDTTLRPSFISSAGCIQIEARVAPGAHAELSTTGGADPYCIPGSLGDGPAAALSGQRYASLGSLSFQGTATRGDPLLGWVFTSDWGTGGRRGIAGADATLDPPPMGTLDAELHTCVAVIPEITLLYPDGATETGGAPAGFVQLSDVDLGVPDCGFQAGGGAWKVGSSTRLAPLATDAFEFVRWEGDIDGAPDRDDLLDVSFDGSQPTLTVRAVYRVRCFDLTIRDPDRVEVGPPPNCQPTDASPPAGPGGSYIAGSDVFLRGTMPGDFRPRSTARSSDTHVWQGWVGDVDGDRYLNPLGVEVDQDRTIGFSYRETTFWEDVDTAIDDFGNGFIELTRKTLGVVTMLAGEFLMGAGPMGALSGVVGLLGGVNSLLEAMGVDTGDFEDYVTYAEQTLTWLGSSYECIGVWSLDDGGPSDEDVAGVTDVDRAADSVTAINSVGGKAATVARVGIDKTARTQIRTTNVAGDLAASRTAYDRSLSLQRRSNQAGNLDKGLDVVAVGVDIYDIASAGGANWADNSMAAWTDPDVLVDCVEKKMPDYLGIDTGDGT